ncbi:MAG: DegT/DnrJ/EryC1/StrS family aminotransferase [Bacteroidota bacterium]
MKPIPFSPPRIDDKTIEAVSAVLRSGWITTGPQTRALEEDLRRFTQSGPVLCLNSWTNAVELILRWFGIQEGDEVLIPAYTYAATANIVVHVGAKPIMVDSAANSPLMDIEDARKKLTSRTKAIMPVDIGGFPIDYEAVMQLSKSYSKLFKWESSTEVQQKLGRPLVIADAAHSFGAWYKTKYVGAQTDVMAFSFHAVKNLTTAEGGSLHFNLPEPFSNDAVRAALNVSALHGQTKDALSKTQAGNWRYDIVEAGYKCNMTDIHAAIGRVELERYEETLQRRKKICSIYLEKFSAFPLQFILPEFKSEISESSYHLFMLRISGFTELQRDEVIRIVAEQGISLNVHFQPLPLLSFYKQRGYDIHNFPNAWNAYVNEISLPVYFNLSDEEAERVADSVIQAVKKIC